MTQRFCLVLLFMLPGLYSVTKGDSGNHSQSTGKGRATSLDIFPAEFNTTYSREVSKTNAWSFFFNKTEFGAVRVKTWSAEALIESPVLIIVKKHLSVLSWQVPFLVREVYSYNVTNRTLCPSKNYYLQADNNSLSLEPETEDILIEVTTLSDQPVEIYLLVEYYPAFFKDKVTSFNIESSPSAPQYVQYRMPAGSTSALVRLEAIEGISFCSYLSVQSIRCPVGDLEADLRLDGRYQTVTANGAIEVSRDSFPDGIFYIVVLVQSDDDCLSASSSLWDRFRPSRPPANHSGGSEERRKLVKITVTDTLHFGSALVAVLVPIILYSFFASMTALITQPRLFAFMSKKVEKVELPRKENQWKWARFCDRVIRIRRSFCVCFYPVIEEILPFQWDVSHYHEEEHDPAQDVIQNPVLINGYIEISPPLKKFAASTYEYLFQATTILVFYSLPVLQLVMTHQGLFHVTGNEDVCYYNFSCANRFLAGSDSNHIISNASYFGMGALFLLQVRRRRILTAKLLAEVPEAEHYGVTTEFGLFDTMGFAMMMEGLMSALYHVCPNYGNFQFDTSFMYLISGLLILKLYHSRHPEILPRSFVAYLIFASIIALAVIGVIFDSIIVWAVFIVFHYVVVYAITAHLLMMGYPKVSFSKMLEALRMVISKEERQKYPTNRFVLGCCYFVLTVVLDSVLRRRMDIDFTTYLLWILLGNLILYGVFYVIMKHLSGERLSLGTCIYVTLAIGFGIPALVFFSAKLTNWGVSPAQSREGNQQCMAGTNNFYDQHDLWHMLSAYSLYFMLMAVLTLDDDLATVPRKDIHAF